MSSNCLFCRIAAQQIPAHVVYQDDSLMAFLDIHPAREGHTLIIPREHHPYFEDIPPALMVRMTLLAQRVARVQKKLFKVERVGMAITGVHVAHAHGRRASRWADAPQAIASMQAKVAENMTACFRYIESNYLFGEWVMGSAYTIADPYLFTMAGWLKSDGVDIADFPKIADHYARMKERPAVRRALAAEG